MTTPSRSNSRTELRRIRVALATCLIGAVSLVAGAGGCFDPLIFNPAFVNQFEGGLFPFVPGRKNDLLLIRTVNTTNVTMRFLVTIERTRILSSGPDGGAINESETTELFTIPGSKSNESGTLFDCSAENPISRIGLGENINRPDTEPGIFVGGVGDIEQGFGVPPNINPLSRDAGDFKCGDTVVFEAFTSANAPGGFKVRAFVLDADTQPINTTRDTFTAAAEFLRDRPTEN